MERRAVRSAPAASRDDERPLPFTLPEPSGECRCKGGVPMAGADDKAAGSSDRPAEAAAGRIGEHVQRARENIADAAASGRDDIAADLRRLSADVAGLRDTV